MRHWLSSRQRIMTDETVLIDNLPDVNDINVLLEAISGNRSNGSES